MHAKNVQVSRKVSVRISTFMKVRVAFQVKKSQSPFPRPMAHRAAPISVSIALGHASANAVKATTGGWSTGSSASLTFPLHSHMSSARREGSQYHF